MSRYRKAILSMGIALGLALAMPNKALDVPLSPDLVERNAFVPTPAPVVDRAALGNGEYVVTLVNSHTKAITTVHGQNERSPPAIHDGAGIVEAGATAVFALPTGWAGRVAMAEKGIPIIDRASLLEGSFALQGGSEARITLDVSYVDGFTVPIVCECAGQVRLGCNLNLLHQCPAEYRINAGTCLNPSRDTGKLKGEFFKACSPWAYTFPDDNLATINGIPGCERNIKCCVGTACAPHPGQGMCSDPDGGESPCSWVPGPPKKFPPKL